MDLYDHTEHRNGLFQVKPHLCGIARRSYRTETTSIALFYKKNLLRRSEKRSARLDERPRALVILKYYKKMSLKDIAARMGISYAYVKILHKSALNKLKNDLSG